MPIRGMIANAAGTALYVVSDSTLSRISSTGATTTLGTLRTRRKPVGMVIGLTQLVVVDGTYGYVYDLIQSTFTEITTEAWLGSATVDYLGGYFTFIDPNTQTFYHSAAEDALTIDALEFATANSSPDKLIGQAVVGQSLLLFGQVSTEMWQESGQADFAYQRNNGVRIDAGLMAAFSAKTLDNSVFWLGRDERGAGMVYRLEGFRAVRVSTMALEEKIQQAIRDGEDVSQAVAYTYQQDGHSFYCLQVPGLDTTWVYDVASGLWHERAELVDGDYAQHRARFHAYCYGKHLVGGDDDVIYAYDPTKNTNAGDVLVRDRISPHLASPGLKRLSFPRFELDCTVGEGKPDLSAAKILLRYSDDGGTHYGSWREADLGAVGERQRRVRWMRCGAARDRVWQVRITDDVPVAIINAVVEVA